MGASNHGNEHHWYDRHEHYGYDNGNEHDGNYRYHHGHYYGNYHW